MKEKIVFIVALIVSILYIFIGNRIVMKDNSFLANITKSHYPRAKITRN